MIPILKDKETKNQHPQIASMIGKVAFFLLSPKAAPEVLPQNLTLDLSFLPFIKLQGPNLLQQGHCPPNGVRRGPAKGTGASQSV